MVSQMNPREVSKHDAASASRSTSAGSCHTKDGGRATSGLPEYEYPVPFVVRNTFIETQVGRHASLDEFFQERQIHSSPPMHNEEGHDHDQSTSALELSMCKSPDPQHLSCTISSGAQAFMTSMAAVTGFWTQQTTVPTDNFHAPAAPPQTFREVSRAQADNFYVPAPATQIFREVSRSTTDSFYVPAPAPQTFHEASRAPGPNFYVPQQATCRVLLSDALQEPELGSCAVPTVGSSAHHTGRCKPCAFFYTKGCGNGTQCPFCHLCPPEEKRRRQKLKQEAFKEMRRQRNVVHL